MQISLSYLFTALFSIILTESAVGLSKIDRKSNFQEKTIKPLDFRKNCIQLCYFDRCSQQRQLTGGYFKINVLQILLFRALRVANRYTIIMTGCLISQPENEN